MFRLALAVAFCLILVPLAAAEPAIMPPEDMVRALLPDEEAEAPEGSRSVRVDAPLAPELELPRISLSIDFEYDTHRLTEDGLLALRVLAAALSDPRLAGMRFQIATHTDGRADDVTKLRLSQRRAQAVADHLHAFYGIPRERMIPVGYGRSRLADPSNPESAANRRVEIVNLAPLS